MTDDRRFGDRNPFDKRPQMCPHSNALAQWKDGMIENDLKRKYMLCSIQND